MVASITGDLSSGESVKTNANNDVQTVSPLSTGREQKVVTSASITQTADHSLVLELLAIRPTCLYYWSKQNDEKTAFSKNI